MVVRHLPHVGRFSLEAFPFSKGFVKQWKSACPREKLCTHQVSRWLDGAVALNTFAMPKSSVCILSSQTPECRASTTNAKVWQIRNDLSLVLGCLDNRQPIKKWWFEKESFLSILNYKQWLSLTMDSSIGLSGLICRHWPLEDFYILF